MKIGLIGISLFAQGAEYVLATLARGLAAHGHEVDVILSGVHAVRARTMSMNPFDVGPDVTIQILKSCRARWSIFELRRLYKNRKYDVVMSHASPYSLPMALATVGLRHPPKTIAVQHCGGVGTDVHGQRIDPVCSIKASFMNRMRKLIDALFVVSAGAAEAEHRMTGYPVDRIFTVYNPVIDEVFDQKRMVTPSHPWLQSDAHLPVVVAAGAFSRVKNFSLLIRAFAKVRKIHPCRLVIFGDGLLRSVYEALVSELNLSDDVSLPGFTNNLPAELQKATCFVVSSYIESFSIVLVEAMACGIPVVATDCPYGPREILEDGRNGILVENDNVDSLADGIIQVLSGNGIPTTPSMVARFTVDSVVNRYESAIQNVLLR